MSAPKMSLVYAVFRADGTEEPDTRHTSEDAAAKHAARLSSLHGETFTSRRLTIDEALRLRRIVGKAPTEEPTDGVEWTRLIDLASELGVSQQTVGNRMTRLKIAGRPSTRNGGAATVLAPEECDRIRRDFLENPAGKGGRPRGGGNRKPKREPKREPKRVGLPASPANVEPPEYVPEDEGESVGDFDSPGKIDDDFTGAVLPNGIDGPPWQAAEGWAPDTGPAAAPMTREDRVANALDQVRIEVAQLGAALKRTRVRRPNLLATLYCSEGMHPRRLIIWIEDVRILGATRIVFGDGFVEAYTDGGEE